LVTNNCQRCGDGIAPTQVAAVEHLARCLDRPGEAVADAGGCDGVEEPGGAEVRDEDAVDRVAERGRLARVAHLNQVLHLSLTGLDRVASDHPVAEGVGKHLQAFVARGQARVRGVAHQGERLPFGAVEVNAGGIEGDVVSDDDLSVTERDVLEAGEGIDGSVDVPVAAEVAADLFLKGGTDPDDLVEGDAGGLRYQGHLVAMRRCIRHDSWVPFVGCWKVLLPHGASGPV
jgi:hypothetical protein